MRDLENRPIAFDRAHMKRSLGCLGRRNVSIFSHRGIFWGFTRRNNNNDNTPDLFTRDLSGVVTYIIVNKNLCYICLVPN